MERPTFRTPRFASTRTKLGARRTEKGLTSSVWLPSRSTTTRIGKSRYNGRPVVRPRAIWEMSDKLARNGQRPESPKVELKGTSKRQPP